MNNQTNDVLNGMSCPSLKSYNSVLPFPDFSNINYASHDEVVHQQSDRSHYTNSLLESGFHHGLHPSSSGKMINLNYGSFGKSQATSDISLFANFQVQNDDREGILQSKTTGLGLSENSYLSWGQLTKAEHGVTYHNSDSWMGTTEVHNNMQSGRAVTGKQRIRWTHELHEQFVEAVNSLGGAMKATPKGILKLMKLQGLTLFHIKSHLQKYRNAKCFPNFLEGKSGKRINHDGMPMATIKGNGGFHISEILHLQMGVQKSLHEHFEFQRKLQMRIEEHANYLQWVFDHQKRGCSFLENHNSKKSMDKSAVECSSTAGYADLDEICLSKPES